MARSTKSLTALASAADPPSAAALAEHKDDLDYQPEDNIEVFEIFVSFVRMLLSHDTILDV
ncbi:hypothetical protein N7478_011736 [Penicillium angulare]|uniref:uncharacterized protein n=1 Tax=Penicillium angulare TaxID=116970 RepID=UPI002540CEC5|nr:uncharacterized protein N7478_011736 [Penicillium angulare]KAJ5261141.1 hypothetical protein N7478_011736 [Penicillium angulare]